jgi:uncharacterized RDD family membrane protein YckC
MIAGTTGREEFLVQGMSGVDLSLPIAGPGSRAYAFLIDWHIRLVLALVWLFAGMLLVDGSLRMLQLQGAGAFWVVILPPILIYFFYHPVVELLMHGQTPGKRMAGVRIVNRDGGPPGAGAVLIRNAFRLLDSMPMFYVVGIASTFVTAQRVRVGDMAAGTLLIENTADTVKAMDRLAARNSATALDPAVQDLIDQLLERWNQMDTTRRGAIARSLLQRIDPAPAQPLAELSDAALRARLLAMSGGQTH